MTTFFRAVCAVCVWAALSAAPAVVFAGQQSDASADPTGSQQGPPSGWSLTPSLLMSRTFDDNVLLHGPGDPQNHDLINVINPRGVLSYNGRLSQVSANYDGAFVLYNELSTLNSFDQHGSLSAKRRLSKRNSVFIVGSAAASPTTELLQFNGVPFVRAGAFTDDVRAGFESLLTKRTTVSVDGHFEQARFDASQTLASLLQGGNAIGADVSLRHRLSDRLTLTADGDVLHATIGAAEQVFDIQHGIVGLDQQLTPGLHVYASGGISRLGVTQFGPPRTGPSWKFGLLEHHRSATIELSYDRSFVPSFGFGGTTQNGSATGRLHVALTRRLYTQDLVSWQQQDPLVINVPQLRSMWLQVAVGYAARPWMRIEGYFAGTRQTVGGVDAMLQHNQYGVQVIASKPVRIR